LQKRALEWYNPNVAAIEDTRTAPGIDDLRRLIADAAAWCGSRGTPKQARDSLRSLQLADGARRFREARGASDEHLREAVGEVVVARAALLGAGRRPLPKGSLLLYSPVGNWMDGAAEYVTAGFYDDRDQPPWDCWLAFVSEDPDVPSNWYASYLVAWIPERMVAVADDGVAVAPGESLAWAAAVDTPLVRRLREAGLV